MLQRSDRKRHTYVSWNICISTSINCAFSLDEFCELVESQESFLATLHHYYSDSTTLFTFLKQSFEVCIASDNLIDTRLIPPEWLQHQPHNFNGCIRAYEPWHPCHSWETGHSPARAGVIETVFVLSWSGSTGAPESLTGRKHVTSYITLVLDWGTNRCLILTLFLWLSHWYGRL